MSSKLGRSSTSIEEHINSMEEPEVYLRKRIRDPSPEDSLGTGELSDGLSEDEDAPGCPLPSTPEDTELLEAEVVIRILRHFEFHFPIIFDQLSTFVINFLTNCLCSSNVVQMNEVLKAGVLSDEIDLGALAHNAAEQAEVFVRKVWEASWKVVHFKNLPKWLQDNDFLHKGHRPPLASFGACFKSIFRLHTETGNIWCVLSNFLLRLSFDFCCFLRTHLLGCIMFIGAAVYFLIRPSWEVNWEEKMIFSAFFIGAILCLGFSFVFHTVSCHSEVIGKLFSK